MVFINYYISYVTSYIKLHSNNIITIIVIIFHYLYFKLTTKQ